MHARPAGLLVKEAKKYDSKIVIKKETKTVEATKLIAIMGLGVKCGQDVEVEISGSDEITAYKELKAFFEVHQMMLEDEDYLDAIHNMIRTEMVSAEYAVARRYSDWEPGEQISGRAEALLTRRRGKKECFYIQNRIRSARKIILIENYPT